MPTIRLNKKDEDFVEQQVKAGAYDSADDMIRAGLDLLREQNEETLRMLLQEGLDDVEAGRVYVYDNGEELLADILRMADDD